MSCVCCCEKLGLPYVAIDLPLIRLPILIYPKQYRHRLLVTTLPAAATGCIFSGIVAYLVVCSLCLALQKKKKKKEKNEEEEKML